MTKSILILMLLVFLSISLEAQSAHPEESFTVKFRRASNVPKALYVQEVLNKAYASIRYNINWLSTSGAHELELVRNGKLTAALARAPAIEQDFPDLVK